MSTVPSMVIILRPALEIPGWSSVKDVFDVRHEASSSSVAKVY